MDLKEFQPSVRVNKTNNDVVWLSLAKVIVKSIEKPVSCVRQT